MEHRTIQLVHLSIGFLLASPIVYSAEFGGGTGTAADPYQVATAEQLISIGADPNMLDKHFMMVNDIDLDPNLSPTYAFDKPVIGNSTFGFSGVFDGNGFSIYHLTIIERDGATGHNLGFFDSVAGGEVKDLLLREIRVFSECRWCIVGGLCSANYGMILRCSVSGTIAGGDVAGGLAGWNLGSIEECSALCTISAEDSGGLIGINRGRVRNCYASGRVSGTRAGGLVSGVGGPLSNCYAACQVDDNSVSSGGLVGYEYLPADIVHCYFLALHDGGGPDNGFGTPLTSDQMKQTASFANWSFWGIGNDGFRVPWFMPEDDYPELAWLPLSDVPHVGGLSVEDACRVIEGADIKIGDIIYDYDHVVDYGCIATAHASGGVPPGSEVDIVVSLGPYDWFTGGGVGDQNDPYLILSPGQIECLAYQPELWTKYFRLATNLNMSWRVYDGPLIGGLTAKGTVFSGTLDGNGYVIKNLTIDVDSTGEGQCAMLGLFKEIGPTGIVKDLGLIDASIKGRRNQETTAGMLCAINGGHIRRCYSVGVLQAYGQLGGLVGSNTGLIEDCYSSGELEDMSLRDSHGLYGGFVASNTAGVIRTCYATCYVPSYYGAGLVAYNESGSIERCLWDVEVSGVEKSAGGKGVRTQELMDVQVLQSNGWGGNPNWTLDSGKDYPHLIWEGMPGSLIPEKPRR